MPSNDLTLAGDEEFGEVPLDAIRAQNARRLLLQQSVEWMRIRTIDVDLVKHRKADPVVLFAESADLVGRPGFLRAELVAREAEHGKAPILVLLVQRFQARVLRRESAVAGRVHDQQHKAAPLGERGLAAVETAYRDLIQGAHDMSLFKQARWVVRTVKRADSAANEIAFGDPSTRRRFLPGSSDEG